MSETTISPIIAALALLALGGAFVITVSLTSPGATNLQALIQHRGRWLAFAVAATAMASSLYYSEIANFPPCDFCWYQRIAMYPLTLILLIAAITNDRRVARYVIPIAVIGVALSGYHVQLQLFPEQASSCTPTVPCHTQWVDEFGFVSIPFMAGSGFLAILALHVAIWRADRAAAEN
jgi:disulfide bond formation protein DsbB